MRFKLLVAMATSLIIASATTTKADVVNGTYGITNGWQPPTHGLWTNSAFGTQQNQKRWKIGSNGTLVIDGTLGTKTAVLKFDAVFEANNDLTATVEMHLANGDDTFDNTVYTFKPSSWENNAQQLYFKTLSSVNITFSDSDGAFAELVGDPGGFANSNGLKTMFQVGVGANSRTQTAFGASSWFGNKSNGKARLTSLDDAKFNQYVYNPKTASNGLLYKETGHYDVNLNIVPEPSAITLALIGLLGVAPLRLRRRES